TSGTTGTPRLVKHSRAGLLRSVGALLNAPPSASGQGTWLSPLPLSTIGGYVVCVRTLAAGDRLVLMPRFHPRKAASLIERERMTGIAFAPVMLGMLLRLPDLGEFDLSSLTVVGVGSSPLSPSVGAAAGDRLGALVVNSYGSTELAGAVLMASFTDPSRFDVLDS